jgi:hypothetical protein
LHNRRQILVIAESKISSFMQDTLNRVEGMSLSAGRMHAI